MTWTQWMAAFRAKVILELPEFWVEFNYLKQRLHQIDLGMVEDELSTEGAAAAFQTLLARAVDRVNRRVSRSPQEDRLLGYIIHNCRTLFVLLGVKQEQKRRRLSYRTGQRWDGRHRKGQKDWGGTRIELS